MAPSAKGQCIARDNVAAVSRLLDREAVIVFSSAVGFLPKGVSQ